MSWFQYSGQTPDFVWFGPAHVAILIGLLIICSCITKARRSIRTNKGVDRSLRLGMVATLIILEVMYQTWYVVNGEWGAHFALPLHLSSITWITAVIMLLTLHRRWFEVTFFAGVSSALLTMITPDIGNFGFPHFRFFHFFWTHGLVIVAAYYVLVVHRTELTLRSVVIVWGYLNAYAVVVFVINLIIPNANYMYLMTKPPSPTPFDWFGPWPYYIFVLQLVSLLLFLLMYASYRCIQWLVIKSSTRLP